MMSREFEIDVNQGLSIPISYRQGAGNIGGGSRGENGKPVSPLGRVMRSGLCNNVRCIKRRFPAFTSRKAEYVGIFADAAVLASTGLPRRKAEIRRNATRQPHVAVKTFYVERTREHIRLTGAILADCSFLVAFSSLRETKIGG